MDSTSIQQPDQAGPKSSRLPAGSVMRLPNGICVPHPNAEVSLPGQGDARAGTAAILETQAGEQQLLPAMKLTESQAAANMHGLYQPKPVAVVPAEMPIAVATLETPVAVPLPTMNGAV